MTTRNTFTSLGFPSEMAAVMDADGHSPETAEAPNAIKMGNPPVLLTFGQIDDGHVVVRNGAVLEGEPPAGLEVRTINQAEWGADNLEVEETGQDQLILYDSDGSPRTFTLPAHTSVPTGRNYFFQSSGANDSGGGGPAAVKSNANDVNINSESDTNNNPFVSEGPFARWVVTKLANSWSYALIGSEAPVSAGAATSIEESSGPTELSIGAIADGETLIRSGSNLIGAPYPTIRQMFWGAGYGENISNTFACHVFPGGFNFSGLDPQPEPMPVPMTRAGTLRNFRLRYHVVGGGTGMALYIFLNDSLDGDPIFLPNGGGSPTSFEDLSRTVTVAVASRVRIVFSGSTSGGPAYASLSFEQEF